MLPSDDELNNIEEKNVGNCGLDIYNKENELTSFGESLAKILAILVIIGMCVSIINSFIN